MRKILITTGLLCTIIFGAPMTKMAQANQEKILHETLTVMPNIEMLIDHSFHDGVKVKGIRIKQVEIQHDTVIKNGEINQGDPNSIYIVIEITDMKGNKSEIIGGRPLAIGDYEFTIEHDK